MNRRTIRKFTILSDLILINLSFVLAYIVRYRFEWLAENTIQVPYTGYLSQQLLLNLLLVMTFVQNKVWQRRRGEFWLDEVSRVLYATATAVTIIVAYTFFFRPLAVSRLMLIWAFAFIVIFISLARLVRRALLSLLYRQGRLVDRALVVGSGEVARGLMRTLLVRRDLGYQAVGYLDDGSGNDNMGLERIPHLGSLPDLEQTLRQFPNLHTVFIALPGEMHQHISATLAVCHHHNVRAQVVPDVLQLSLNRVEFNNMAGIPILGVREVRISRAQLALKRALDLTIIALGGIPALLVGLVIALAIKLDSPGPVLYAAERVGRNGKPFTMYKFRSMVADAEQKKEQLVHLNEADGPIFKIRNDPRLTRVGRFIRRTSLDELPQIINVLRGEMSLVGPRPPLAEEVAQYKPWHRQRLEVIGGITGLWQVSGRSDLTFDELCLLDIYYIENWSLSLDLRILLQTIPYSLFGQGAY